MKAHEILTSLGRDDADSFESYNNRKPVYWNNVSEVRSSDYVDHIQIAEVLGENLSSADLVEIGLIDQEDKNINEAFLQEFVWNNLDCYMQGWNDIVNIINE